MIGCFITLSFSNSKFSDLGIWQIGKIGAGTASLFIFFITASFLRIEQIGKLGVRFASSPKVHLAKFSDLSIWKVRKNSEKVTPRFSITSSFIRSSIRISETLNFNLS